MTKRRYLFEISFQIITHFGAWASIRKRRLCNVYPLSFIAKVFLTIAAIYNG